MNQTWKQIVVSLKGNDNLDIERVSHLMFEAGAIGLEVDYAEDYLKGDNEFGQIEYISTPEELKHPTLIRAYFELDIDINKLRDAIKKVQIDSFIDIQESIIEQENWEEGWKEHFKPEPLTRFMTIVPSWYEYEAKEDERVILIDPGSAFGTGTHPTTQLGAQALEIIMREGEVVLDVGTGTGILSFIAASLGASRVIGYDLDPNAIRNAKDNVKLQKDNLVLKLNAEDQLLFEVNDLLKGVEESADIIVANILPHILVDLLDDAYRLLNSNGYLILGGILEEKAFEIENALTRHNWSIVGKHHYQGWLGYIVKKETD